MHTDEPTREAGAIRHFFSLTPERVLEAVERSGPQTTGLCWALNSLENRVYEVELEDRSRVVAKFYRPGRWGRETILDEHRLLAALAEAEVPVCAPTTFPDGQTLHTTADDIFFALFPRTGGRSPDELAQADLEQLGRLLARIHNVSASLDLRHRPALTPTTYGTDCLGVILERCRLSAGVRERYIDAVVRLVRAAEPLFADQRLHVVHADCHRANLLRGRDGWFFLDFDDSAVGPAVQDLWLLLPARAADCPRDVDALLTGYEQMRDFDRRSLRLIEALRGLRYVRYAAWIASRWDDPSFTRAFSHFGTDAYWEAQTADLYDQLAQLES